LTYLLLPHAGDRIAAGVGRRAAELNQPPFPLLESYHRGDLPQRGSFLSADDEAVLLTVLKGAEDGDGALVVRAYETAGRATEAGFTLFDRRWTADFAPHEIKTFRIPAEGEVTETNLVEWPGTGGARRS
jgi:alpha-mannosidase